MDPNEFILVKPSTAKVYSMCRAVFLPSSSVTFLRSGPEVSFASFSAVLGYSATVMSMAGGSLPEGDILLVVYLI